MPDDGDAANVQVENAANVGYAANVGNVRDTAVAADAGVDIEPAPSAEGARGFAQLRQLEQCLETIQGAVATYKMQTCYNDHKESSEPVPHAATDLNRCQTGAKNTQRGADAVMAVTTTTTPNAVVKQGGRNRPAIDDLRKGLSMASVEDVGVDVYCKQLKNHFIWIALLKTLASRGYRMVGYPADCRIPGEFPALGAAREYEKELLHCALAARQTAEVAGLRIEKVREKLSPSDYVLFSHDYAVESPPTDAHPDVIRRFWRTSNGVARLCVDAQGESWMTTFDLDAVIQTPPTSRQEPLPSETPHGSKGKRKYDEDGDYIVEAEPEDVTLLPQSRTPVVRGQRRKRAKILEGGSDGEVFAVGMRSSPGKRARMEYVENSVLPLAPEIGKMHNTDANEDIIHYAVPLERPFLSGPSGSARPLSSSGWLSDASTPGPDASSLSGRAGFAHRTTTPPVAVHGVPSTAASIATPAATAAVPADIPATSSGDRSGAGSAGSAPTPCGIQAMFMPTLAAKWSSLSQGQQARFFAQMTEEQKLELLSDLLPA